MSVTPTECNFRPLEEHEDIKPQTTAVRRNLFGPVDHQQLQQDVQRQLCMSLEIATQRWNFEFQMDQPVSGSNEWEELPCQDVPAFYRSCVVRSDVTRLKGGSFACSPGDTVIEKYLKMWSRGTLRGTRPDQRMAVFLKVKHKQANITDFFRVTKRRFLRYKNSSGQ